MHLDYHEADYHQEEYYQNCERTFCVTYPFVYKHKHFDQRCSEYYEEALHL